MHNDLNRRNTQAAFDAIKEIEIRTVETRQLIDAMSRAIATLAGRLDNLELTINMMRISAMGQGPTEK